MTRAAGPIGDYVCTRSSSTRHGILIDPADQAPEVAAKRAIAAATAGSKMVLVGGSTDTDMDNVHATVVAIKEALELVNWASSQDSEAHDSDDTIPVILFPQGAAALSPAADGITFMMLMNSTDPQFLVGEQVAGAPYVKESGVEPIPMGYVICAPGGKAGKVGKADLIQPGDTQGVASYAMAAECYGFRMLYLEAGSGASEPVSTELIRAARDACDLTLVIGGGIKAPAAAKAAADAGADWVITGTLTEGFADADELRNSISHIVQAIQN